MPRFVLVLSCHRSGSTLLNLVLGSHPASASLGEFSKLQQTVREAGRCTCNATLTECPFWREVAGELERRAGWNPLSQPDRQPLGGADLHFLGWARVRMQQRVAARVGLPFLQRGLAAIYRRDPAVRTIAQNTLMAFEVIAEVASASLLIDSSKNPFRARSLVQRRPDSCRIIYLVRDGRGVMASMLGKGQSGSDPWHDRDRIAAARWRWENQCIRRSLTGLPRDSWLFLRYEDFCREPEKELRRICEFLGLDFDPRMLVFREASHHDVGGNRMRFSDDGTIRLDEAWRRKTTKENLVQFEAVAGALNRALGYVDDRAGTTVVSSADRGS